MIHLTNSEETLRIAAFNLILKRKKRYSVFGSEEVSIRSILTDFDELNLSSDRQRYILNGIIIAMTVPLVKIYFMSNDIFPILKSNRDKLGELATFIERSTLRVV